MVPSLPTEGETGLVESTPPVPVKPRRFAGPALIWAVVACLLLGSSAVVRGVQDRRHGQEAVFQESCPFPLERIPLNLGHWTGSPESQKLDSKTLLITGGKEHLIRTYADESTGVRLVVLILFGPAEPVIPHVPEVCYPANGFGEHDKPINRTLTLPLEAESTGSEAAPVPATFRSAVYQKARMLEGVYYSFRYNGQWTPDVDSRKLPRRSPGVIKIQIQRPVSSNEQRDGDKFPEPIEDFLKSLIPAIEREIRQGTSPEPSKGIAAN